MEADQAREQALAEYRRKLLAHKEVDAQVSEEREDEKAGKGSR